MAGKYVDHAEHSERTAQAEQLPTGMVRIDGDAIGCTSQDMLADLARLQIDGDVEAAQFLLVGGIATGECRVFYDGDFAAL